MLIEFLDETTGPEIHRRYILQKFQSQSHTHPELVVRLLTEVSDLKNYWISSSNQSEEPLLDLVLKVLKHEDLNSFPPIHWSEIPEEVQLSFIILTYLIKFKNQTRIKFKKTFNSWISSLPWPKPISLYQPNHLQTNLKIIARTIDELHYGNFFFEIFPQAAGDRSTILSQRINVSLCS